MSQAAFPERESTQAIVGEKLSAVTFVLDYWQFQFDGSNINALTRVEVESGGSVVKDGDDQFRNRLCEQIGKIVAKVDVRAEAIFIGFKDQTSISISLREQDYRGPEGAICYGKGMKTFRVFRGD